MGDIAFIKELPFAAQIAINIGIFIVTIIVGLRSYYAGKKTSEAQKDVILTSSNAKFIEDFQDSFETMSKDVNRVAHSLEVIEKHLSEFLRNAEIDREVRRITGERKRGSTKPIEISLDTTDEV